jgi:hypothetical protein
MMSLRPLSVLVVTLAACHVSDVDLTGKQCPCPSGWVCRAATNTCARTPGPLDDAGAMSDGADAPAAGTYRDAVIADTPLSYWRLGDSGTVAKDEMGVHDGTYVGGCTHGRPGAIAGDSNTATAFDGSSCEVQLPDAFGFPGNAPFTVEAWFDLSVAPTIFFHLFTKETRDTTNPIDGYSLLISPTIGVEIERVVAGSVNKSPAMVVPTGQWAHAVAVYDGTQLLMYVDGVSIGTRPETAVANAISTPALIGAQSTGSYFTGDIDEVAIYDHALSAARIALHHQLGVQAHD